MPVRRLGSLLAWASLLGCYASHERPIPPLCGRRIQIETTDAVDLLFLVDNSNSMAQEQDLLRAEIPRMIAVATATATARPTSSRRCARSTSA